MLFIVLAEVLLFYKGGLAPLQSLHLTPSMIGMRYQPEHRKICPFCPICNLFIFGGAIAQEGRGGRAGPAFAPRRGEGGG